MNAPKTHDEWMRKAMLALILSKTGMRSDKLEVKLNQMLVVLAESDKALSKESQ